MVNTISQRYERKRLFIHILILVTLIATLGTVAFQTCTLSSDYEARSRPYLAIEDIAIEKENGDWLYVWIEIVNLGEVAATNIRLDELRMGGEDIAWTSSEEYVVAPEQREFPSDLIFLPGRHNRIPILVHRATWEDSVMEGKVLEIELTYSWPGKSHYHYLATGIMESEDKWRFKFDRGE